MHDPERLLISAQALGATDFAGVPCSILDPINTAAHHADGVRYLPASVEGEAVAFAAGVWLGGGLGVALMQNSGLGNAINPLASLAIPYRIPMLLIVSWRGEPGLKDAAQHLAMGEATPGLLELLGIPTWVVRADSDVEALMKQAMGSIRNRRRPAALLIPKGAFAKHGGGLPSASGAPDRRSPAKTMELGPSGAPPSRMEVVQALAESHADAPTVSTTGYMSRTLYAHGPRPSHFYMQGSMGFALAVGLGLSEVAQSERIFVLDGDGALLMRLGTLATVGWRSPKALLHVVFDNGCYASTGGQPTVAEAVDFAAIAAGCGYRRVGHIRSAEGLSEALEWLAQGDGPALLHIPISRVEAAPLPRPTSTPPEIATRFKEQLTP